MSTVWDDLFSRPVKTLAIAAYTFPAMVVTAVGAVAVSPIGAVRQALRLIEASFTEFRSAGGVISPDPARGEVTFGPYFPTQAAKDLRKVREHGATRLKRDRARQLKYAKEIWLGRDANGNRTAGPVWHVIRRPLAVGMWTFVGAGTAECAVLCATALAGTWFTVYTITAILRAGAAGARAADAARLGIRGIRMRCPHPWCFARITLPGYRCPQCSSLHEELRPGSHGVLHHVCACGARLPALPLTGRYQLEAYCPGCQKALPARIGAARLIHIPLFGSTSAGKTTLLIAATERLLRMNGQGPVRASFPSPRDEQDFDRAIAALRSGASVNATNARVPSAFLIELSIADASRRTGRAARCLVYLYDPMGEVFTTAHGVRSQQYLAHADGLLFVVDPLTSLARNGELTLEQDRAVAEARPAPHPADAVDRVIADLQPFVGRRARRLPVAVAVSKADVLEQVGDWCYPADASDGALADWLAGTADLSHLTRTLAVHFDQVAYWGVSATRDVKPGMPAQGAAALDPVLWLLGRRGFPLERVGVGR